MRKLQTIPGRQVALALGFTVLLAGCETGQSLAPDYVENTNQIRSVSLKHAVIFAPKSGRMSKAARGDLTGFLQRARVRHGDRIIVSAPADVGKKPAKLARTRLARVGRYMRFRGLKVQYASHRATGVGARVVRVSIERSVVIAPDCPDWDTAVAGAVLDGRPDRFGCMNAAALAAMIADPNDLKRGKRLEAGDGEYQERAIRNYRSGKAKAPAKTQTK
ncbi:MAG: CpaD family pilus assembly protein [Alphaproteobacteria bacterium]|nr:CpaD family pilus assembly protein [Alphaproteobacteria bacterium]